MEHEGNYLLMEKCWPRNHINLTVGQFDEPPGLILQSQVFFFRPLSRDRERDQCSSFHRNRASRIILESCHVFAEKLEGRCFGVSRSIEAFVAPAQPLPTELAAKTMRRLPRRHRPRADTFYDSNDPVPGANSRRAPPEDGCRAAAQTRRESPGQTSIAMASMSAAEINIDECALIPIGVETLRATGVLPFDLYLQGEGPSRPVLYREKKLPVGDDDLEKLLQRGVRTLYIPQVESSFYREYLRQTLLSNNDIPPVERYQVLREATRSVLTDALAKGDHESAVKVTSDLSEGLVQAVCDSQIVLNDLLRVMSHDYSIFTHAVNVATNCLLLARWYGINGRAGIAAHRPGRAAARHRTKGRAATNHRQARQAQRARTADRAGPSGPRLPRAVPPRDLTGRS